MSNGAPNFVNNCYFKIPKRGKGDRPDWVDKVMPEHSVWCDKSGKFYEESKRDFSKHEATIQLISQYCPGEAKVEKRQTDSETVTTTTTEFKGNIQMSLIQDTYEEDKGEMKCYHTLTTWGLITCDDGKKYICLGEKTIEELRKEGTPESVIFIDIIALLKFLGNSPFKEPSQIAAEKAKEWRVSYVEALERLAVIKWKQRAAKICGGSFPEKLKTVKTLLGFTEVVGFALRKSEDITEAKIQELDSAVDEYIAKTCRM